MSFGERVGLLLEHRIGWTPVEGLARDWSFAVALARHDREHGLDVGAGAKRVSSAPTGAKERVAKRRLRTNKQDVDHVGRSGWNAGLGSNRTRRHRGGLRQRRGRWDR